MKWAAEHDAVLGFDIDGLSALTFVDRTDGIADRKAALRKTMLGIRDGLDPLHRAGASQTIAERVVALADRFAPGPVSLFWPIRSEIDTRPLMAALDRRGVPMALPAVVGADLVFRAWRIGAPLRRARFGLSEPCEDAAVVAPKTLFVPLAAFDAQGRRLGYGGGFYDRAIAALMETGPIRTIGLAFAAQQVASVPVEPHDRRLDSVVTEDNVFSQEGS